MLWAVQARPSSISAPQFIQDADGNKVPILMLDDSNGTWYCGGKNYSQAWTPSGGGGLALVTPQPTADPRVFTLPKTPSILLLFVGMGLQYAGNDKDFVLNGQQITFNYTPEPGLPMQAVVG